MSWPRRRKRATSGHNYIGTEHILLGLLRQEQGVAAPALLSVGIVVDDVRADVARIIGAGDEVTTEQIPFTPRGKKILELGLREALALGHNHIGPEHILLGLARENGGVAAQILWDRGISAQRVASAVYEELGQSMIVERFSDAAPSAGTSRVERVDHLHDTAMREPVLSYLLPGFLLFGIALGIGILIGWAIWG